MEQIIQNKYIAAHRAILDNLQTNPGRTSPANLPLILVVTREHFNLLQANKESSRSKRT